MIKLENTITPSPEQWEALILGARNPMNSWNRYDSGVQRYDLGCQGVVYEEKFVLGPNDYQLLTKLAKAGTDHRKFMRMIPVYVTITAPLLWWKEADTYQVGVVKNSCSTMHKIHEKEFTLDDFSCEHLGDGFMPILKETIFALNSARQMYLEYDEVIKKGVPCLKGTTPCTKKDVWYQMIYLLPTSYNQKRTVMLNYEVLANMYKSRKAHKLDEWVEFCKWIESLPYSELITGGKEDGN
jgi:hypothetical protein